MGTSPWITLGAHRRSQPGRQEDGLSAGAGDGPRGAGSLWELRKARECQASPRGLGSCQLAFGSLLSRTVKY